MHTGMLWFDNDPKTSLRSKIIRAADYYRKKYRQVPNLCLVNPNILLSNTTPAIGTLMVRPYRPVLPGHLWIGIEDKA